MRFLARSKRDQGSRVLQNVNAVSGTLTRRSNKPRSDALVNSAQCGPRGALPTSWSPDTIPSGKHHLVWSGTGTCIWQAAASQLGLLMADEALIAEVEVDEALITEVEAKIEALRARLPHLEGKANKRERTAVNKEIYMLENTETYVAAVKRCTDGRRAVAAAADDAVHAEKLQQEAAGKWVRHGHEETDPERTLRIYWRNCVEDLFDEYAPTFEKSLVQQLGYNVPEKMEAMLAKDHADAHDGSLSRSLAIDLGCGTGLAGQKLRTRCHGKLIGCDLSSAMVEQARKKHGVFDSLEASDCVAFLHRRVKPMSADLIVAADVLIYIRDLSDAVSYTHLTLPTICSV